MRQNSREARLIADFSTQNLPCFFAPTYLVKEKIEEWESKGLFLFFLPPYCSEMNDIELEWQHLKRDELCGQMFETESELACHVIWGLENRGEEAGHTVDFVNLRPLLQPVT